MKTPAAILNRQHRRSRWLAPLWIIVVGLTLDLVCAQLGVARGPRVILLGAALLAAFVTRWLRPVSVRDTARELDEKIESRNRFEAFAEMSARDDALASAIRHETQSYVAARRLPRPVTWLAGLALLGALFATSIISLSKPPPAVAAPAAIAATPETPSEPPPAPEPEAPLASLLWVTPAPQINAAPHEQVPLEAEAASATGLHRFVLHAVVNGEPRPPIEITATTAAGTEMVKLSLELQKLNVEPYGVVAYHLAALRTKPPGSTSKTAWPEVASPLQFVEVRPVREELPVVNNADAGEESAAGRALEDVRRLRHDQMEVLKETFALDHDLPPRTDPGWSELVQAAEERQKAIDQRTMEVLTTAQSARVPAAAIELLTQAKTESGKAASDLARSDLAAAAAAESRAISRLAEAEKIIAKAIPRRTRVTSAPAASLPPREQTPAGQLEKFAAEQKRIADELARRAADNSVFSDQDRIARGVETLSGERSLPSEVRELIKLGAAAAKESARQLNEQDTLAATEPATRAAQHLAEAVEKLNEEGAARAAAELTDAQRAWIRAATDLQTAAPSERSAAEQEAEQANRELQAELSREAREQQAAGSAEAASLLEKLARAAAERKAGSKPGGGSSSEMAEKLAELAQQAANARGELGDQQEIQEQASQELQRVLSNLPTAPAAGEAAVKDLYERAVASSQSLPSTAPGGGQRGGPSGQLPAPGLDGAPGDLAVYAAELGARIEGILQLQERTASETRRAQVLTTANPAEAPPIYRPAVADYFESLAKERSTLAPKQP